MSLEDQTTDRKSLKIIVGKTANWEEVAKDCVCFANGQGGRLLIGIEDGQELPPDGQQIPHELLDKLRKRIGELTVNVRVLPHITTAENGAQYIELRIDRSQNVASTHDGRYFIRVADTCQPVLGDKVDRGSRCALSTDSTRTHHAGRFGVVGGLDRAGVGRVFGNIFDG